MPSAKRRAGNRKTAPRNGPTDTPALSVHPYPRMVTDHYVARLREMRRERRARLAALKTRRQARAYQERVQAAIERAFSPRPRRTPLQARVTGVHETRRCRVENVRYESRPGCVVTANLYVPHGCDADHPRPGVIGTCGHSAAGKGAPIYQAFAQRLAANGFVTLVYDPFNQGERDQYAQLPRARAGDLSSSCCFAHNMMGKQLELCGEFFGMWRAWDGIRGLDYLLTRPEVDPAHLGVTGNSGGGTMSTWLWGVEDRFSMAAPSCFVTTFASNLENELPADNEQYPPGVLGAGLEEVDFLIARAPKPALLLGQSFDFFDRRGLREAYAELKRFYALLGAPPGRRALFIGPQRHGFSWHNQEAMVRFFQRHAGRRGAPKQLGEKQISDLGRKLWVTPKGSVVAAGAVPIFEQIAAVARRQDAARKKKRPLSQQALPKKVRRVLNIEARAGTPSGARKPPHYRAFGGSNYAHGPAARYAIETEFPAGRDQSAGRIRALLVKPRAHSPSTLDVEERLTLYLPHVSSEAELNDRALAGRLIGRVPLYALDVRGLGESMPTDEDFFHPYGYDYMHHGHGLMFGQSYLGRRVFDVLRTMDLLVSEGARAIDLIGRGQGALGAAFAGLLCPKTVRTVTLHNGPLSFLEWATSPVVRWPAANFPRGVLKHFDLPEVTRALAGRVRVVEPWDAEMKPLRRSKKKAVMPGPRRRRSA